MTPPTPRPHAEKQCQYAMDDSLEKWRWIADIEEWHFAGTDWDNGRIYHVGHEKPTAPPKRMCELGGIVFEAPETVAPAYGTRCWLPNLTRHCPICTLQWNGCDIHLQLLADGEIHLNPEAAALHSQGLAVVNMAAVKGGA